MNKTAMLVAALCVTAVTQVHAMHLSWAVDLIDNENDWNYQPGLVQLYTANGTLINQTAGSASTLGAAATFHQGTIGQGGYNWLAGQQFYFKVYNAITVGGATEIFTTSLLSMPTFTSANDAGAASQLALNIDTALTDGQEYIALDDARWQQAVNVSEPASLALFGIAVGALAWHRKANQIHT